MKHVAAVTGDTPGLYGGTRSDACDARASAPTSKPTPARQRLGVGLDLPPRHRPLPRLADPRDPAHRHRRHQPRLRGRPRRRRSSPCSRPAPPCSSTPRACPGSAATAATPSASRTRHVDPLHRPGLGRLLRRLGHRDRQSAGRDPRLRHRQTRDPRGRHPPARDDRRPGPARRPRRRAERPEVLALFASGWRRIQAAGVLEHRRGGRLRLPPSAEPTTRTPWRRTPVSNRSPSIVAVPDGKPSPPNSVSGYRRRGRLHRFFPGTDDRPGHRDLQPQVQRRGRTRTPAPDPDPDIVLHGRPRARRRWSTPSSNRPAQRRQPAS